MQQKFYDFAHSVPFQRFIIGVIVVNAIVVGLETSMTIMETWGPALKFIDRLVLWVFIIEALVKIVAVAPRVGRYFRDPWNLFDFTIVVASLIPATGSFATVARLLRLLRVLRLISALPELRLIVTTLVRSIPSMGHVVMLMSILFYIYAIAGFHLFSLHDPVHWGSVGHALLTLFRIVTLEDWTDVMYTAMTLNGYAWIYFVSFVIVGTFVVINLFIAVVLNNLDEAKQERLAALAQPPAADELLHELKLMQARLGELTLRLESRQNQQPTATESESG
jgi:voltage-gated sodium channel